MVVVFGVAAIACTPDTGGQPAKDPSITKADAPRGCPFGVEGAQILVTDTADGVQMDFTVSPSSPRLADLRERVADASAMHGSGEEVGKGHNGKHQEGGHHGLKPMQLPAARGMFEKIEAGGRLVIKPVDPADLTLLRTKVRERARAMAMAECGK
jgi:hypothetical protein